MADTTNAFVLQHFDLANNDTSYMVGAVIPNVPTGQFNDWQASSLVRVATDAEVQAAALPMAPILTAPADDQ